MADQKLLEPSVEMRGELKELRKFWEYQLSNAGPDKPKEHAKALEKIAEVHAMHAQEAAIAEAREARLNPTGQIICPHCHVKGKVALKAVDRKKGISGGKATGALLTGGISLVFTGLSRYETETEATCGNCRAAWHF